MLNLFQHLPKRSYGEILNQVQDDKQKTTFRPFF